MTRVSLIFVSTFAAIVIAFVPQPGPEVSSIFRSSRRASVGWRTEPRERSRPFGRHLQAFRQARMQGYRRDRGTARMTALRNPPTIRGVFSVACRRPLGQSHHGKIIRWQGHGWGTETRCILALVSDLRGLQRQPDRAIGRRGAAANLARGRIDLSARRRRRLHDRAGLGSHPDFTSHPTGQGARAAPCRARHYPWRDGAARWRTPLSRRDRSHCQRRLHHLQAGFSGNSGRASGGGARGDPYLTRRLRETTDQLETIALYDLESRVARFLLATLRQIHGEDLPDSASLQLALSQTDIAGILGASRPRSTAPSSAWKNAARSAERAPSSIARRNGFSRLPNRTRTESACGLLDRTHIEADPVRVWTTVALALTVFFLPQAALESVRELYFDALTQAVPPQIDDRIVVVDIDRAALAALNGRPWGRAETARLSSAIAATVPALLPSISSSAPTATRKVQSTEIWDRPLRRHRPHSDFWSPTGRASAQARPCRWSPRAKQHFRRLVHRRGGGRLPVPSGCGPGVGRQLPDR